MIYDYYFLLAMKFKIMISKLNYKYFVVGNVNYFLEK